MKIFFLFKQRTAYEMVISDWSSDVCSSDLKAAKDRLGDRPLIVEIVGIVPIIDPANVRAQDGRQAGEVEGPLRTGIGQVLIFIGRLSLVAATDHPQEPAHVAARSEKRRVGKECVSTCNFRWSPYH